MAARPEAFLKGVGTSTRSPILLRHTYLRIHENALGLSVRHCLPDKLMYFDSGALLDDTVQRWVDVVGT